MGFNFAKTLENSGLTNKYTPDIGQLIGVSRKEPMAYCTSQSCCNAASKEQNRNGVYRVLKKDVRRNAYDCPDCHYVLFWE